MRMSAFAIMLTALALFAPPCQATGLHASRVCSKEVTKILFVTARSQCLSAGAYVERNLWQVKLLYNPC
jgi:hypothetical protein